MTTASETAPQPAPVSTDHEGRTIDQDPLPTGDFAPADPPIDADVLPAVIHDAELVTEEAEPEKPVAGEHPQDWEHDRLEFRGDNLAVRIPEENALTSVYESMVLFPDDEEFQQEIMGGFVQNHISAESRKRVLRRMNNPDDEGYAGQDPAWPELMRRLSEAASARIVAAREAAEAAETAKSE